MKNKIGVNKRGQEEITGFVLVIVIVSIVLLIFLAIFIRKDRVSEKNSLDIHQFLESAMELSTGCELYRDVKLGELIKDCYSNSASQCDNGMGRCTLLNISLNDIIGRSWDVGENKFYKGVILRTEINESEISDVIIEVNIGDCSGSYREGEYLSYYQSGLKGSSIVSTMRLCF